MGPAEIAIRFVAGGACVSIFALLGEVFAPKTFGGIFGAAPSVALATLFLTYAKEGPRYVAIEARSMIAGAIALVFYGGACAALTARRHVPVGLVAIGAWLLWGIVAAGGYLLVRWGART